MNISDLVSSMPIGIDMRVISGVLNGIEIAEECIAEFKEAYPAHAQELDDAFLILKPLPHSIMETREVYRHHCNELLRRVVMGEYLSDPTMTEMLVFFNEASLKAPLSADFAVAYFRLASRVLPEQMSNLSDDTIRETYDGAVDEVMHDVSRKMKNVTKWRGEYETAS